MKKSKYKISILFVALILLSSVAGFAQAERKLVKQGNELFTEEKYDEALLKYRDASVENPELPAIHFNMGNALYKKKNYEEALKEFEKSLSSEDAISQAEAYYNMGNTMYRQNKLLEAITLYQKALKLNPDDEDAKYNLEYVRRKLKNDANKQQQNQQQQQQQQQQKQQQQNQDQQKEQEKNQEQQQEQQQNQQQDQKNEEKQQQEQEQQAAKESDKKLSKEDAERILNALKQDEKDALKKNRQKVRGGRSSGKDW